MPITFDCACGERLEVDDDLAGRQVRCPVCEGVLTVPRPMPPRAKRAEPLESDDDRGAFAPSLNPFDPRNRRPRRRDDD
jgi:hypothetical protein